MADLVTGAFGNTGSAIAQLLRDRGRTVRTLTDHPPADRDPEIHVEPFAWGDPSRLAAAFEGVETFVNTYWMRHGDEDGSYDLAADRCIQLIDAAETAGVSRLVHISVANVAADSPYPYFRAKARVEARLRASAIPTLAVRPTLVFGGSASLLEDLGWLLRRLPVFAVAGDGRYRVRPVHVDDLARLCVDGPPPGHVTDPDPRHQGVDAVGPDRPTYRELVDAVRAGVGSRTLVVPLPTSLVLLAGRVLGTVLRTELLDRDELVSTMEGIADTDGPATGETSVLEWIAEHGDELGRTRPRGR